VSHWRERLVFACQQRSSEETIKLMVRRSRLVARHVLVVAGATLLAAGVIPRAAAQTAPAPAETILRDFAGIEELQSRFDRESDKVRVVLLLSPT
jgi:hypothetical protein